MDKRIITEKQETALRLVHQDFEGLEQAEAARQMGISQQAISQLLAHVKEVMPQYFPLLAKIESERYHLYMIEGWSVNEIAEHFGLTPRSVQSALQRAKDKGMFFSEAKGRVLSYDEDMDAEVKEQF